LWYEFDPGEGDDDMNDFKNEQAERLFEALEGVDPELLERSEKKKKVFPFMRVASVMAACIALFVVGSLSWGGAKDSPQTAGISSNSDSYIAEQDISLAVGKKGAKSVMTENSEECDDFAAQDQEAFMEEAQNEAVEENVVGESWNAAGTESKDVQTLGSDRYVKLYGNADEKTVADSYFSDKKMVFKDLGSEDETEVGIYKAQILYNMLNSFDKIEVKTNDFKPQVTIAIYDTQGELLEKYEIAGKLIRYGDSETVFEISDENFDLDELIAFVKAQQ